MISEVCNSKISEKFPLITGAGQNSSIDPKYESMPIKAIRIFSILINERNNNTKALGEIQWEVAHPLALKYRAPNLMTTGGPLPTGFH